MGRLLDPRYSTIIWFFALFTSISGFITIAVPLSYRRIAPTICRKLLGRKFRVWFSVLWGTFLPSLYIAIFVLAASIGEVPIPLGRVLVRGLAMILVSILGFYLGSSLAAWVHRRKVSSDLARDSS